MSFLSKIFKKKEDKYQEIPYEQKTNMGKRRPTNKLFRISKPYGYFPKDVEDAIQRYTETINKLKNVIVHYKSNEQKLIDEIGNLNGQVNQLENKVKELILQLSMLDVPNMSDAQEHLILSKIQEELGTVKPLDIDLEDSDFHVHITPVDQNQEPIMLDDVVTYNDERENENYNEDDGVFRL